MLFGIILAAMFCLPLQLLGAGSLPDQSYCAGYGKEKADILWGSESNSHLSAAVKLDENMLQGSELIALKFFMATAPKMRDCQIFITRKLDSAGRLYEQEFTPEEGWNYVWLDYPLSLNGFETIYIGYEATCTGEIIGAATTSASSVEADLVRLGNGQWQSLSELRKHPCELALAAILTGGDYSGYPPTGIMFIPDLTPQLVKADMPFHISGTAINTGISTTDNMSWEYSVDNLPAAATGNIDVALVNYATTRISIPVEVAQGQHQIEITLKDNAGNSHKSTFSVEAYERAYPKIPLVELFTSQYCSNCPGGDATLQRAIKRAGAETIHISHHAGFTPDYFTIPESETLAEFFGIGTAPSMMLDRTPVRINGTPTLVYHPGLATADQFHPLVSVNTLVGIEAHATWHTPDEMLKMQVTVEKDAAFEHDGLYLNVAICENNVNGFQQDKGSTHTDYSHNHMPRVILTQVPAGNIVKFTPDGKAVFEFTTTLPEVQQGLTGDPTSPSVENLSIVAFVASHNPGGKDFAVFNSTSSPVEISHESSINAISADNRMPQFAIIEGNTVTATQNAVVYDLCGQQIATIASGASAILPNGIYILRANSGNVMKIAI